MTKPMIDKVRCQCKQKSKQGSFMMKVQAPNMGNPIVPAPLTRSDRSGLPGAHSDADCGADSYSEI